MNISDIIQWAALAVILAIVAVRVVRKVLRFRRSLSNPEECACSCSGCPIPCGKRQEPHAGYKAPNAKSSVSKKR